MRAQRVQRVQHRTSRSPNGTVRIWAEEGVTIPIGDTTAHIRVTFGHERISPSDSDVDIRRTFAKIKRVNKAELAARVEEMMDDIAEIQGGRRSARRARR